MLKPSQRRIKAVSDDQLHSVVFLGAKSEGGYEWGGVGTWVSFMDGELRFEYLITAAHVVGTAIGKSVNNRVSARINLRDGSSGFGVVDKWVYGTEGGLDLAVSPAGRMPEWETVATDMCSFATDEAIRSYDIGPGDSTITVGLYPRMLGKERNSPLVRSGVIAGVPTDTYSGHEGRYKFTPYLVECRSLNGVSGSPVYVRLQNDVVGPCANPDHVHERPVGTLDTTLLLGIIHGHWDLKATLARDGNESFDEAITAVNEGISVVTRASDIARFIENNDELVAHRLRQRGQFEARAASSE